MSDKIISAGFAAMSLGMILIATGSIFRLDWALGVGMFLIGFIAALSVIVTFIAGIMGVFGKGPFG